MNMHKVLHKKVHFGFALMVILALGTIPAVFSVALMVDPVREAEAIIGQDASLEIVGVPLPCSITDPITRICGMCGFCGTSYPTICNGMTEIQVRALNQKTMPLLEKTQALCLTKATVRPPNGGSFRPGSRCIGKIMKLGPFHQLFNFGCYK